MTVTIGPIERKESEAWLTMRAAQWPESDPAELTQEIDNFFAGTALEKAVFLAKDAAHAPIGMLELSLRPYADGCKSSPVPYIEGWYVVADARRKGVGTALVEQAEIWARDNGFTEIASDSPLDNDISYKAHLSAGFQEVERVVLYRRKLD